MRPGYAATLRSRAPSRRQPRLRDRVGYHDSRRCAAAEAVLREGELVVEGVRRRDAERARDERKLVRGVGEGEVEAAAAREPPQGAESRRHRPHLGEPRRAGVRRADDGVLQAGVVEQLERLGELARGDRDVVTPSREQLDQRAEEGDVRRVGDVDPDAHQASAPPPTRSTPRSSHSRRNGSTIVHEPSGARSTTSSRVRAATARCTEPDAGSPYRRRYASA